MIFETENLFEPGRWFEECHAAYILEMPSHELFVSFFAGSKEKARDVGSWLVSRHVAGDSWSPPRLFVKAPKRSMGGAHFFIVPGKPEAWIFYNLMQGSGWSTCSIARHVHRDGHWLEMDYLRRMIGYCTRGKILVLDNGDYLHPVHDELLGYKAYFFLSNDGGSRWKKTGPVKTRKGCLEPTVVQLDDGRLLCFLRTKEREIFQSWSLDRGKTWTTATSTGLPNPDSMVDLLVLDDGTVVLAYNHSKDKRTPLVVSHSTDNGKTWTGRKVVASGERELSYPCMIQGSDGLVHLVYTNGRRTIGHARFDKEWMTSDQS